VSSHLSERGLIEAACGSGEGEAHLRACARCRRELEAWQHVVGVATAAAADSADAAMGPSFLEQQRRDIMARVDDVIDTGRVLMFPSSARPAPPPLTLSRWVAVAAAAGLVVGVFGGRFAHDLQVHSFTPPQAERSLPTDALLPTAEEQLLDEVETARSARGPAALGPLDALTPVAWDLRD
jgi:hypothetical protein